MKVLTETVIRSACEAIGVECAIFADEKPMRVTLSIGNMNGTVSAYGERALLNRVYDALEPFEPIS